MTDDTLTRSQMEAQLNTVREEVRKLTATADALMRLLAKDCLEGASVDSRVEANADMRTPMVTVTCLREPYLGRQVRFNAYKVFEDRSLLSKDIHKVMPELSFHVPDELRNRVEEECVKAVMRDISLRVSKRDVPWLDAAREELDRAIARSVQNG